MSNNFDGPVLLDSAADYFGFGRAPGTDFSSGPRILTVAGNPNGVTVAPRGSVALRNGAGATVYVNTDGVTAWTDLGAAGGGEDWNATLTLGNTTGGVDAIWTNGDIARGEDVAGGAGGDMTVRAGNNTDATDFGGNLFALAGNGVTGGASRLAAGSGSAGPGGDVEVQAGGGTTVGGDVSIMGGNGTAGDGGNVQITAGAGAGGAGNQGGAVFIDGVAGDPPGQVRAIAGNGLAGAAGAAVTLIGGDGTGTGGDIELMPGNNGSVVAGLGGTLTTRTEDFLYIPTSAGPPTGVPTGRVGMVALVFDTLNNDLYVYDGAWVSVGLV